MPLLKTKAIPVSDAPNCESWASLVLPPRQLPKQDAAHGGHQRKREKNAQEDLATNTFAHNRSR